MTKEAAAKYVFNCCSRFVYLADWLLFVMLRRRRLFVAIVAHFTSLYTAREAAAAAAGRAAYIPSCCSSSSSTAAAAAAVFTTADSCLSALVGGVVHLLQPKTKTACSPYIHLVTNYNCLCVIVIDDYMRNRTKTNMKNPQTQVWKSRCSHGGGGKM